MVININLQNTERTFHIGNYTEAENKNCAKYHLSKRTNAKCSKIEENFHSLVITLIISTVSGQKNKKTQRLKSILPERWSLRRLEHVFTLYDFTRPRLFRLKLSIQHVVSSNTINLMLDQPAWIKQSDEQDFLRACYARSLANQFC